jgi:hypothetical protein
MGDNGHADGLDGFAYQQVLVRYLEEACTAHASFRCEPAGTHPHRHRSPQHESEGTTSTDRELPREAESNSTKRLRGDAATSKQSQRLDAGTELMGSTGHPDDGHGHLRGSRRQYLPPRRCGISFSKTPLEPVRRHTTTPRGLLSRISLRDKPKW